MNTAFVTGATGFIGVRLVEELVARGARVRALVRNPSRAGRLPPENVDIVHGTIEDTAALARGIDGADTVFHLAALTGSSDARAMDRVNIAGTTNVVDTCLRPATPPKLVFVSSQAAGGPSRDGRPVDEHTTPHPVSAYGASKLAAERIVEKRADALPIVIVRPPSVYGPGDVAFLSLFRLARAGFIPIPRGLGRLAVVHVDDLVQGLMLAAGRGSGTYYFTDGAQHTGAAVARAIAGAVSRRARVVRLPDGVFAGTARVAEQLARIARRRPPLTRDRVADAISSNWSCSDARARSELDYASRRDLDGGMRETAAWYRSNGWL